MHTISYAYAYSLLYFFSVLLFHKINVFVTRFYILYPFKILSWANLIFSSKSFNSLSNATVLIDVALNGEDPVKLFPKPVSLPLPCSCCIDVGEVEFFLCLGVCIFKRSGVFEMTSILSIDCVNNS